MTLIACILAGGRSSRFGASKLNVRIDGVPLLAWQARRVAAMLRPVGPVRLWLSVFPEARGVMLAGVKKYERVIEDDEPFAGPLAGIASVLRWAEAGDVVVVIPADMPAVRGTYLRTLVRALELPGAAVAMGRWRESGVVEPMPSAWHVGRARRRLAAAMRRGVRGPSGLSELPWVTCLPLGKADVAGFVNINERRDLAAVRRVLGKRVTVEDGW